MTPFYANFGFHPRSSWPTDKGSRNPYAKQLVHWMDAVISKCWEHLGLARDRMGRYYDLKRMAPPEDKFKKGDLVMLDGRNIKTKRATKKMDHKQYGLFKILRPIGTHAFELDFSNHPGMKVHNVFHVSLLEPYRPNKIPGRKQQAAPLVETEMTEEDEQEYEVERIMDSVEEDDSTVLYLVKWKNYDYSECTWEDYSALNKSRGALREFHRDNPDSPRDKAYKGR